MLNSLYISRSALSTFTELIAVVSNNIANAETPGYKANQAYFADLLNKSVSRPWADTTGCGVTIRKVSEIWTQGSFAATGVGTDLMVNGSGMFVIKNSSTGALSYTRDGSFQFDKSGHMVYSNLSRVQGYPIDENGNLGMMTDIAISFENSPPRPTTEMSTTVNLNAAAEEDDTFNTVTNVYDSLGNKIPLTITYTKTANANEWNWTASIPSEYGTLDGDSSGTATFDSDGNLVAGTNPEFTLNLTNGAASQDITWSLYDSSGDSNGMLTQFSAASVLNGQSQNGCGAGELTSVSINEDGIVEAVYSNDETKELFQLALADFNNYNGLRKTDGNVYTATSSSGEAIYGPPGAGRLGGVVSGGLENSNVDLATEMTELITAQSAYQANARAFSVSSEMLQTLVNLK